MSQADPVTDVVEAIVEHAQGLARLDPADPAAAAAVRGHVAAMRLLALPHMDPQPDRDFVRQLRRHSADVPGVFVRLADAAIELLVDGRNGPHRFRLWNRRQWLADEPDCFDD